MQIAVEGGPDVIDDFFAVAVKAVRTEVRP